MKYELWGTSRVKSDRKLVLKGIKALCQHESERGRDAALVAARSTVSAALAFIETRTGLDQVLLILGEIKAEIVEHSPGERHEQP